MKVKELDKTVNVAWSPPAQHPILLAAGTAAQQLDASFSTSASLELHALNLGEPGTEMQLQASVPSDQRFHKVVWGTNGAIVGGCDGGLVQIYNSVKLLAGEKAPSAKQDKHTGAVRALDFNPFQSNLLATGAADSEIYIWDLHNITTPMTPGAKSQPAEDVAWISWNRQVQHILASSFSQRCVVWDLRKNEPIIKLNDSQSRIRWKVVSWHPEVATQLCLASEEDSAPVIQLWDLRFATSPIRSLEQHHRGVLSIAWCMQDPDLLLSCGKDNRILCWNPNSNVPGGEVVCEVATTTQWNFDVAWCPRNPALMSSCSFDGHVSIYSLTGGTQSQVQTSNKIADSFPGMDTYAQASPPQPAPVSVDLRKPPKWLRRPCGASFGFGGKLVSFEYDRSTPSQQAVNPQQPGYVVSPAVRRTVSISQVVTESVLIARAQALDIALQQGEYLDFCRSKSAASRSEHGKFLWECLCANFEPNPSSEILTLLGFNPDKINGKLDTYVGRSDNDSDDRRVDGLSTKIDQLSTDVNDAFYAISASSPDDKRPEPASPFRITTGDDPDGLICQALLMGQTEAAVELCLQEGRSADAIILAMTGGADLLARTQYRYFQKCKGYLSTLIAAVATEDWTQVIASCELDSWKEALVATLTHTRGDEFSRLCEQLGYRLEEEAGGIHKQKAQLCFAISGNLQKLVENWMSTVRPTTPQQMQELVEIVAVLRTAVELKGRSVDISGSLADSLSQYAEFLASQGSLASALVYLSNSQDERMTNLRDRLTVALGYKPIQSAPQRPDPRRASTHSHRGSISSSGRQPPYYYNQVPAQQNFAPNPASFPPAPYNAVPSVPVQPIPPVQQYTGVSPSQTQPTMSGLPPGPSQSPCLPRAPSVPGSASNRKYILDPSVQTGHVGFPGQPPNQTMGQPGGQPQMFSTPGYSAPAEMYNPAAVSQTSHAQSASAQFPAPAPATAIPAAQAPPGWNDPPTVKKTNRPPPSHHDVSSLAPITHPLFGTVPQEQAPPLHNINGGYDPVPNNMGGPMGGFGSQPSMYQPPTMYQQAQVMQPQSQPQLQPEMMHPQMTQLPEQSTQTQHNSRMKPDFPRTKVPIPEEHVVLQTVFDDLRNRCSQAANNPQSKRKLEDVSKKLEVLYDALRDQRLSQGTLQSLHELMQMVRGGDYANGLALHTQLVSGPDFSQISSFMPGLKVLLQSALQLGVYLQ